MGTYIWGSAVRFRSIGTEEILNRIKYYRKRNDFKNALFTIEAQKPERAQEMVDMLLSRITELEAPFYLALAKQYKILGNMDEAAFWTMLGSFRLRVDDFVCEGWRGFKASEMYYGRKREMEVIHYILEDKDRTVDTFVRMLDWDKKNRPWTVDGEMKLSPGYFCHLAKQLVDEYKDDPEYTGQPIRAHDWPLKYAVLRALTKKYFEKELDGTFSWKEVFEQEGLNEFSEDEMKRVGAALRKQDPTHVIPNQTPIPKDLLDQMQEEDAPSQTDDTPEQDEGAE